MKTVPIFTGRVEQGKLIYDNPEYVARWLKYHTKGPVEVTIAPKRNKRSNRQNRYYYAYLEIIANETGSNADDLHEYFKYKLLPPRTVRIVNKMVSLPASTTKLTKGEFVEYLMKIAELTGIPEPDPLNWNVKLATDE